MVGVYLQRGIVDPEISAQAGLYLRYLLFGAPAVLLFENLKRYLQAQVVYQPTSLGLIGAPISIAITYWLMFIFLAIYAKFINGYQAWEWWTFEFISLLSGYLGEISLASQGIIITTANLLYQIPYGFSVSASTRIGNLLGAGLVERAKTSSKISMQLAATVALLNATVLIVFKDYWGLSRQNIGAFLTVPGYFIIGVPIGILVAFNLGFGLQGLWIGSMTSSFTICIILNIIIWRTDWQRQLEKCKERMKEDRDKFEADVNYDKDETQSEIARLSVPVNEESNYCVMKFIALRDILKELTISYIQDEIQDEDVLLSLQSRRQKLLSEYYFLCQCCKCITKEH
ncbi:15256_t:CDS:2, partial [Racocetra fulgida]